jgi:hypothetical protein
MAKGRDELDRLRNTFECPTTWESMAGDGCLRFCGECRRHVLDFGGH